MNTMEFESIIINASIKAKEDTGYQGAESDLRSFESYWDLRKKYSKERDEEKIYQAFYDYYVSLAADLMSDESEDE